MIARPKPLGREEAIVTIHCGMFRSERRKIKKLFKQDKEQSGNHVSAR
ncbi:MAG: hypothetical protein LBU13_10340 [Synergistaceae bacterium]|nr:hypothetical protein [Synergistaceae bacterium]